jgi:hypothetical protein
MTTDDSNIDGVWRDDERLPLAELAAAVAVSADDGQTDDVAGNDAGIEQALQEQQRQGPDDPDPDPTSSAGRALRTDFTGPAGPH